MSMAECWTSERRLICNLRRVKPNYSWDKTGIGKHRASSDSRGWANNAALSEKKWERRKGKEKRFCLLYVDKRIKLLLRKSQCGLLFPECAGGPCEKALRSLKCREHVILAGTIQ